MNQGPNGKATGGQSSDSPKQEFPCEYALREKGVDGSFVAQRLIDMLNAKGKRWNTVTKSWESFEDYKVRLAALEQIAKLLGLYPTQKELEGRHKPHETILRVEFEKPLEPKT
jgi:hypothetical protein